MSKPKLVVEIAKTKTIHYAKICREVKRKIDEEKLSKIDAKDVARKLLVKYKQ